MGLIKRIKEFNEFEQNNKFINDVTRIILNRKLHIKPEVHDISVLNDVLFTFHVHFAGFFHSSFRTVMNEIVIFNDFGANETFFKIGVNNSGALRGFPTLVKCPGTNFLRACCKKSLQI